MELILIRHGLPVRDDTSSDPHLTEEGHDQSARVALWLSQEKVDVLYSSPMVRARQTAEPFAKALNLEVSYHDGIVEFDRESGSYIPMEELKRTDYPRWKEMVDNGYGIDMGAFSATVVSALEEIIAANPKKKVAVFCHGGVINVWTAHVLGLEPKLFFEPRYTSVHRYLCASTGQRNIVSLNEVAHLRD